MQRAVNRAFRPEFLNRLDRVVVFLPLSRDVMRGLLRHELEEVLGRRGFRLHPWAVEWDEAALDFLLEKGFSAELGARPLKRAIERHLLAPLAMAIVERQFPEGDQFLFIGVRRDAIRVTFVDPDDGVEDPVTGGEHGAATAGTLSLERLVGGAEGSVTEARFLEEAFERTAARLAEWTQRKDEALAETRDEGFWDRPDRATVLGTVEYLDRIEAATSTAETLLRRMRGRRSPGRVASMLAERLYLLDGACAGLEAGEPSDAVLSVRPSPATGAAGAAFAAELVGAVLSSGPRRVNFAPVFSNGRSDVMCLPGTVDAVRDELVEDASARAAVSRRAVLAAGGLAALSTIVPAAAEGKGRKGARHRRGRERVQDLTHVFAAGFPVYTGDAPARRTLSTVAADGFYSQAWSFGEHSGTHMDAPGHFTAGGRLVDELSASELVAPIAVIDISERAASDADAAVTASDVRRYERRHGRIPRGAIVFMYSGWERRLPDAAAFKNAGPDGTYHFPGWGTDGLEAVMDRRIQGIGVDTLSLDIGASKTFDVHKTLLGADRYGLENVANLSRIPPRGARAVVGVIPWQEGSGGPCRLLAMY